MAKKEKVRITITADDGTELLSRIVDSDKSIDEALEATVGFGSGVSLGYKKREVAAKILQTKGVWSFRGDYLDDCDDAVENAKITVEITTIPVRITENAK